MKDTTKSLRIILLLASLLSVNLPMLAQKLVPMTTQKNWSQDYPPVRIAGSLYYVGTYDLACYLITTPEGDILINTGIPGSAPMIRSHVEALGFKFRDIRLLLATHAHFDHVGDMAAIKKMTRAKLLIQDRDAPVLADGGNSDYVMGGRGPTFEPVTADSLLHEHDTINFGGMQIMVLHHPGHTKGACSFLFDVKDEHRLYRVLIANMPSILDETKLSGMPGYPDVGKDYAYTLDTMKNLSFDIWLSSHASQFGLQDKHQPGDPYRPEAFIDRQGYDAALNELQKAYDHHQ
jgi:metallo-beta-lactamase class B